MLAAVLSDPHGNRHALEAVLAEPEVAQADERWCLGDVVGYGAEPEACVALVREHCAVALCGNHDLAVTGALAIDEFSDVAATAARWTARTLSAEAVEWLSRLLPVGRRADVALYHASPRDPVWEYVITEEAAAQNLACQDAEVALVGHSHVALSFRQTASGGADGAPAPAGTSVALDGRLLLNPGSVGQPRDRDPRAAWLLLDTERATATWHRTDYDIAGAQAAIREAGLPARLADRLAVGR